MAELEDYSIFTNGVWVGENGINTVGRINCVNADIETEDDAHGVILRSPSGYRFVITVDDDGSVDATQISASPEVDINERRNRINSKRSEKSTLRQECRVAKQDVKTAKKSYQDATNDNQKLKALKDCCLALENLCKILVKETLKDNEE